MVVAVAFDHRGIVLRDAVIGELERLGAGVVDLGTDRPEPRVDYPDKALELGRAIRSGAADRGVFVCSSGIGAAIAASKVDGIRAAVCHDGYSAHQGVEHDDMNVLCLGSEIVGPAVASELVHAFVDARFDGGERYVRRLRKLELIEETRWAA
jgi:ribose 5-phosphate isomerase B